MRNRIPLVLLAAVLAAPAWAQPLAGSAVRQAGFEVEGKIVRLVWLAPQGPVTGYLVERRNASGEFESLTVGAITATALDVTASLLPDRTNVFRVIAVVAGKSLAPSDEVTIRFVQPRRAVFRHPASDLPSISPGASVVFVEAPTQPGSIPAGPPALPVGVQNVPVVVSPEQPAPPRDERRMFVPVAPPPPALGSSAPPPPPAPPVVAPASAPAAPAPPAKAEEPKRKD